MALLKDELLALLLLLLPAWELEEAQAAEEELGKEACRAGDHEV